MSAWSPLAVLGVLAPALACLLAELICRLCHRRASAAAKHLVWMLAFVMMAVCLPLALGPFKVAVPVLPPVATVPPAAPAALPVFPWQEEPDPPNATLVHFYTIPLQSVSLPKPLPSFTHSPGTPAPDSRAAYRPLPWRPWLLSLWAAGLVILSGKSLAGALRLRRLLAQSRPSEDPSLTALWIELGASLGLRRTVRLSISPQVSVPLVTGLWRPSVLLPEAASQWPAPMRRAALIHELAHLRRHDLWSAASARLVASLYWFHPLAWHALRALRAEAEMAADDFVVTTESQPVAYAESLVTLVRTLRRVDASPFPAIGMLRRAGLETRVQRILDPACHRLAPHKMVRWGAACSAVLLGAGLAVLRPVAAVPPLSPPGAPPVAAAAPAPFAPDSFRLEADYGRSSPPHVEPLLSKAKTSPFDLPMHLNYAVRVVYDYSSWIPRRAAPDGSRNWNVDSPGPGYREQKAAPLNRVFPAAGASQKDVLN